MSPARVASAASSLALCLLAHAGDRPDGVSLKLTEGVAGVANGLGMRLVPVKAGRFTMGSADDEEGRRDEEIHRHEVEITKDFWLGAHEVTQKQFREVMGQHPSHFSADGKSDGTSSYAHPPAGGAGKVKGLDTDAFPVENVTWLAAVAFVEKLNARPQEKAAGWRYRLPTEAEWEYACRGGPNSSRLPFHAGPPSSSLSSRQANFNGDWPAGEAAKGPNLGRTCKVGSYRPNRLGLYDMHGNVWEWCADWCDADYYKVSPKKDPAGPDKGHVRSTRGGCYLIVGAGLRAGGRGRSAPVLGANWIGFRVAAERQ